MRPMFHDGVWEPYRPRTPEQREAQRQASLKRLGLQPDQRRVYGVVMSASMAQKMRPWAARIAARYGYAKAQAFAEDLAHVAQPAGGIRSRA